MKLRAQFSLKTLRDDAVAGLVLGVQSIPDGLANGLLAGVNPLFGLYAYLVGTFSGALFTSSAFMAVQGTGAMAMVVADVPAVHGAVNPARALFTLSILVGVFMLLAGFFKLGTVLRFVSNAVMVGFLNAVGVNIILGQLASLTGYEASGANRVLRALNTLLHPGQLHLPTLFIGVTTIVLIVLLERTRLGSIGMVVAVVVTSAAAAGLGWNVAQLKDIAQVPNALPLPQAPMLGLVPVLLVPALALAFVGLVQGAGISANYPNPDGNYPDPSRDFIGQGAANVACGVLQGMPVGGSLSATALGKTAGAKSRQALLIAGAVMAITILLFARLVGEVAMPALAGLLMVVGYRTISPEDLQSVWRTGNLQKTVLGATFVLTLLIPLQFAVLVGVALSVILHAVSQSNQVTIRRREFDVQGNVIESDPPRVLPPNEVVVLQPYGSLFFAAAPVFDGALPEVAESSRNSVVVLRLRGYTDLGSTFMDVLKRYAEALGAVGSRLIIVSGDDRVLEQLAVTGVTDVLGSDGLYRGDERVGATVRRAQDDAVAWVERNGRAEVEDGEPTEG